MKLAILLGNTPIDRVTPHLYNSYFKFLTVANVAANTILVLHLHLNTRYSLKKHVSLDIEIIYLQT